jgi:succinate dehydrogenase / fumarate reductase membrane anchor subunit
MIPVKDSQMRTPLRRVRGLGSGHSGTTTFWHQRLTSIAGVPLTIAVVVIVIALLGRSHATARETLGSPLVAIIMLLFILNTAYHMWIGLQEIIVDYVHDEKFKLLAVVGNTFFAFGTGFAAAFAILKLSFGV